MPPASLKIAFFFQTGMESGKLFFPGDEIEITYFGIFDHFEEMLDYIEKVINGILQEGTK